ncbi:sulfotransferase family protein [Paenibacillus sp. GCM10012307]|uniref:Sulfotransferase n=1 Tax=Paenibacillus roseus TaxID=2798579 RepID=A0A934MPB5_9BACL|nr:sulfotransferase [Paenibacillus roseus]MBJ6360249.1 sulfotransferase [Paenibacillus roseus]
MIQQDGSNLVFLLCTPRSGSSLATVMLQNHSKVFATQEMWFLMSLYDLKLAPYRPYGGTEIIKQFFNGVLPEAAYEQACRSFAVEVYNSLLKSGTAEKVIDKSPRYYYLLEFIDQLFPNSKRIWLIRNPLSVIASYKKVNRHVRDRFDLKGELTQPKFNIKMADITIGLFRYMDYFSRPHPHTYRLYYEQLAINPQEEMRKLCEFLDLSYEEGLERYGDFMDQPKSDLFFSMGVGDPFVGQHTEPHTNSLDHWKEVLDKEETELYCRAIGARVFHELGYSRQLEEAEAWTGVRFDMEPDAELLELRRKQLAEATGCQWQEKYQISSELSAPLASVAETAETSGAAESGVAPTEGNEAEAEVVRLQMTLRALDRRLEKSYANQKRLQLQLDHMRNKVNRIKSLIPFGSRLSRWASAYLASGGSKK